MLFIRRFNKIEDGTEWLSEIIKWQIGEDPFPDLNMDRVLEFVADGEEKRIILKALKDETTTLDNEKEEI